MIRQRCRSLRKVATKSDNDVLRPILLVAGCDAEADPLKAVRRNIPRPRFRFL